MEDAGYIYVNVDDSWEGERDTRGNIHPNGKFPDMKALADYCAFKRTEVRNLFLSRPEDLRRL